MTITILGALSLALFIGCVVLFMQAYEKKCLAKMLEEVAAILQEIRELKALDNHQGARLQGKIDSLYIKWDGRVPTARIQKEQDALSEFLKLKIQEIIIAKRYKSL